VGVLSSLQESLAGEEQCLRRRSINPALTRTHHFQFHNLDLRPIRAILTSENNRQHGIGRWYLLRRSHREERELRALTGECRHSDPLSYSLNVIVIT
jgi:hypothetical protein